MTSSITTKKSNKKIGYYAAFGIALAVLLSTGIASNAYAADPVAKARAIQNGISLDTTTQGVLNENIDCVGGIDSSATVDSIICYLVPDGVPTPDYATDPSVISQASSDSIACPADAGFNVGDQCFSSTFDSSNFVPGDWRFIVEFYNGAQLVALAGIDYRVHTFFVVPESPIGAAALVGSALAVLGGYSYLRRRGTVTTTSAGLP